MNDLFDRPMIAYPVRAKDRRHFVRAFFLLLLLKQVASASADACKAAGDEQNETHLLYAAR